MPCSARACQGHWGLSLEIGRDWNSQPRLIPTGAAKTAASEWQGLPWLLPCAQQSMWALSHLFSQFGLILRQQAGAGAGDRGGARHWCQGWRAGGGAWPGCKERARLMSCCSPPPWRAKYTLPAPHRLSREHGRAGDSSDRLGAQLKPWPCLPCHKRHWCTTQPTGETEQEIAQRLWWMTRNTSKTGNYHLAAGRGGLQQGQLVAKPHFLFGSVFSPCDHNVHSSLCLSYLSYQKIWLFKYIINSGMYWRMCATSDPSSGGEDEGYPTQHSSGCWRSHRAHLQRKVEKVSECSWTWNYNTSKHFLS